MASSNILTINQLGKMTNEQLVDFAMKLQDNLISKQTELINGSREFREKLNVIETKFGDLKKENDTLQSKVMIAKKTSMTLFINNKKLNGRIIEMVRKMHRLEQYPRRKYIEIAEAPSSITNDLLEEHVNFREGRIGNGGNGRNIVACYRLGETGRVIVKLLNRKDAQNVLEENQKLRIINGTIKIRESSRSKPVSITHESDLQFGVIK